MCLYNDKTLLNFINPKNEILCYGVVSFGANTCLG